MEELKSDDCDDNDEEFDESICCGLDLQTKEEYEARMVEIIRRFRQNYETNCRLMRESSNLACDAVETENEPNKSLDIIESMNEVYVENENEKSITLSDWYISLTSQLSVVLIGKRWVLINYSDISFFYEPGMPELQPSCSCFCMMLFNR